ncbi:ATP-binding protein [Longimicrobium sp.]|uniref:ATP-binding protein n=1 Tax=Longimicrobium sp. TaxID=2029185 RepID=UPI002D068146|nr:ATP-binding protein [Longimicrobium sp.]HSU14008.1 ATP-binding protein [Longimicrobium sp.]
MLSDELRALVSGGESQQVEFKRSTGQRTESARTVCAMLNTRGGFVLFGVTDSGEVRGQEVTAGTLADVVREISRIEPRPLIAPDVLPVDERRSVVLLRVPEASGGAVYTFEGRPYVRIGPTTVAMGQAEYRQRLLDAMHPTSRWETQRAHGIGLDDLDHAQIVTTIEAGITNGRIGDPGTREPRALLRGLGLLDGEHLLNAAVALFGRSERLLPFYPQCSLRLAAFKGVDKSEFLDNRQVTGNVFDVLDAADRFIRMHVPVAGRVVPNLFERRDDPLYPPVALREALANAVCHRDYAAHGGSIAVAIFDDRMEISNPGRLPAGFTLEDLARPHVSVAMNPLIASALYRRGIIEQWGSGTLKILELTERAGLAVAEFEVRGPELVARFSPNGYVPPSRAGYDLTPLQQEILEVLAREGGLSSDRLRPFLSQKISDFKALAELRTLVHLGLVRKVGVTRGVRWIVAA